LVVSNIELYSLVERNLVVEILAQNSDDSRTIGMENVIIVKKNDQERYGCPSDKCYGAYKKFKSLSAHVCRNHPGLKVRRKEKMTAEELKMKSREYRAKYIGKKKLEKKRCTYSIEDAEIRGTHKASEAIVEVKKSSIKGAGRGIFVVEALQKGDTMNHGAFRIVETKK